MSTSNPAGISSTDIKFSYLRRAFKASTHSGSISLSGCYRNTTEQGWSDAEPSDPFVRHYNTDVPTSGTISFSDFAGAWDGLEIDKMYIYVGQQANGLDIIYLAVNKKLAAHQYVRLTDDEGITDWTFEDLSSTTYTVDPSEIFDTTDRIAAYSTVSLLVGPSTYETFLLVPFTTRQAVGTSASNTTLNGWPYPWNALSKKPRIGFFKNAS